jgi:phage-related protein
MRDEAAHLREAAIAWEGDSKEVISSFPDEVRQNLGFQLRRLRQGQQPSDYRPMPSIGQGVFELRDQDGRAWYRVIYLSRIRNVLHVLHCFEKKSRGTPQKDIGVARQRLRQVKARTVREKGDGKREQ